MTKRQSLIAIVLVSIIYTNDKLELATQENQNMIDSRKYIQSMYDTDSDDEQIAAYNRSGQSLIRIGEIKNSDTSIDLLDTVKPKHQNILEEFILKNESPIEKSEILPEVQPVDRTKISDPNLGQPPLSSVQQSVLDEYIKSKEKEQEIVHKERELSKDSETQPQFTSDSIQNHEFKSVSSESKNIDANDSKSSIMAISNSSPKASSKASIIDEILSKQNEINAKFENLKSPLSSKSSKELVHDFTAVTDISFDYENKTIDLDQIEQAAEGEKPEFDRISEIDISKRQKVISLASEPISQRLISDESHDLATTLKPQNDAEKTEKLTVIPSPESITSSAKTTQLPSEPTTQGTNLPLSNMPKSYTDVSDSRHQEAISLQTATDTFDRLSSTNQSPASKRKSKDSQPSKIPSSEFSHALSEPNTSIRKSSASISAYLDESDDYFEEGQNLTQKSIQFTADISQIYESFLSEKEETSQAASEQVDSNLPESFLDDHFVSKTRSLSSEKPPLCPKPKSRSSSIYSQDNSKLSERKPTVSSSNSLSKISSKKSNIEMYLPDSQISGKISNDGSNLSQPTPKPRENVITKRTSTVSKSSSKNPESLSDFPSASKDQSTDCSCSDHDSDVEVKESPRTEDTQIERNKDETSSSLPPYEYSHNQVNESNVYDPVVETSYISHDDFKVKVPSKPRKSRKNYEKCLEKG